MSRVLPPHKLITRRIIWGLIGIWAVLSVAKFTVLGYTLDSLVPRKAWDISIETSARGNGDDISIRHFLPPNELGQIIAEEKIDAGLSNYHINNTNEYRQISFDFEQKYGPLKTKTAFRIKPEPITYQLPDFLEISAPPAHLAHFLQATETIQKDDSLIAYIADTLGITEEINVISQVQKIFDFAYIEIEPARFSGTTDAVLTCKLGEASCNGKSRLMVALARHVHIPARLVGGLILQGKSKRTTHQWVELYIQGVWIPFCPLNGHFAYKPGTYATFYRGDHAFFRHDKDIGFDFRFYLEQKLVPKEKDLGGHRTIDIINIWNSFIEAGIPLNVLSVILMIPIGALVTIIFRNVIGVHTFGTFLPALISYSFLGTGLINGMFIFTAIITGGAVVNIGLSKLKLLHTPRLTIIMIFTIACLLSLGMLGVSAGNKSITQSFFFPLAILSITIERFFIVAQENGLAKSMGILGWTLVVVFFCYLVMSSLFLQMIIVILPETYLLILAAALYFGHWTGLRVSELIRFKSLIGNPHQLVQ